MPTYDYRCINCGVTFEKYQNMSDPLLLECSSCGGKLERLIGSGAGLIIKGSAHTSNDCPGHGGKSPCERGAPCCGRESCCSGHQ